MADSNLVLLVEGASDQAALETLAKRRDRDLKAEGISIVAMGGSSPVGDFLERLSGTDVRLAGLCDQGEWVISSEVWSELGLASGSRYRRWSPWVSSCAMSTSKMS